jgi:ligand-binding sensor domain-containing protein/signal transduction histidine kinase
MMRLPRRWLFAALSVCALAAPVWAQSAPRRVNYIQRSWDTRDGLPQNTVRAIAQTRDGYLWLGTFGGLVRFDGNAFTVFDPGNTPGLTSARIVTLFEDRKGVLWIGTESGLIRYEHGRFTPITALTTIATTDGVPHDEVVALTEDRRGRLWIGTPVGIARFDGQEYSWATIDGGRPSAVSLASVPNGDVWAGRLRGVAQFQDGERAGFVDTSGTGHFGLAIDAHQQVWLGGSFLRKWDGARAVEIPLPIPRERYGMITALAADRDGAIWIGTVEAGLWRLHDGRFESYADGSLSNTPIRSLLVDRDGNLWIGTDVNGLIHFKPRRVFSHARPGSIEQSIGPVTGDGAGGLWIGATCGGLVHFLNGTFKVYGIKDGLSHDCIWALHRDPDNSLWIGSTGGGLQRFRDGRFETFHDRNSIRNNVYAITRDRSGVLWIGSEVGLSRLDAGRYTDYGVAEGISDPVRTIMQDRTGALWIGGQRGLKRFNAGRVDATFTTADGLSHNHVRAIHEDADGVLWIGTYGGGLNRYKAGRFTTYGIKDGLHDVAVSRIIEDDRGNLWMSGNKGIYRVARSQLNDFADGRIAQINSIAYGMADGMVVDETNGGQPAGWRTDEGRFWFPTIKGLVEIDAAVETARVPPVFVERTMVDGAVASAAALQRLGPGHADAEFQYTAVDLAAAEKTRFRYRLQGYDAQWIEAGSRRTAFYTNIPPGEYRFEVIATDSDGRWTIEPAGVALVVTPLLWQRRPVQAAGLVLLLVASVLSARFVFMRRARARVAELEREQALERERSRIARDLHDDLGSRLAQIAIIAEGPAASRSFERVSGVAHDAMRTMDELVWTVNARNDTVESFSEYAVEFANEHLTLAGVRYRLQIQPDLEGFALGADTRRHLYLAFKEAIHNIVKHASASEVHIRLTVEDGILTLEVADDGRGLPAEAIAGTGNGLRNMRERMEAAHGSLQVESSAGGGTRLTFCAPLGA